MSEDASAGPVAEIVVMNVAKCAASLVITEISPTCLAIVQMID